MTEEVKQGVFHRYGGGPAELDGKCPYIMTGNANEMWDDFLAAAWQFGQWASTTDVSGLGPSVEMTMGRDLGTEEFEGKTYKVTDGITLRLGTEFGLDGVAFMRRSWSADVWAHFTEVIAILPGEYPDGKLTITNQPAADGPSKGIILHLWHD